MFLLLMTARLLLGTLAPAGLVQPVFRGGFTEKGTKFSQTTLLLTYRSTYRMPLCSLHSRNKANTIMARIAQWHILSKQFPYSPLNRNVLEMTTCERVETTIRRRQLWFAGTLVRQDETRCAKRIMFRWVAAKAVKEVGWPPNTEGNAPRRT